MKTTASDYNQKNRKTVTGKPFFLLKKSFLLTSLLLCICICSCQKNVTDPELPSIKATPVSEDLNPGNIGSYSHFPIMETENGYYFNPFRQKMRLIYFDKTTKKDIYLCNKPECQHDGNEYCVATSAAYIPLGMQLYSDHLYIAALCEGEDKLEYRLLEVSLDGSSLTEISTYYTHSSMGFTLPSFTHVNSKSQFLIIHRNYAILPLYLCQNEDFEETKLYGTVILNLETGDVTSVYEETLSEGNHQWTNISACGDYIYYVVKEEHKQILHRYHLLLQTDESFELLSNFSGIYTPLDDNRILYDRSQSSRKWLHTVSENTNTEIEGLYRGADLVPSCLEFTLYEEGMSKEELESLVTDYIASDTANRYEKKGDLYYVHLDNSIYSPGQAHFDGKYLYLMESRVYPTGGETCFYAFHVYDTDFHEITWVEIPFYEEYAGKEGPTDYGWDVYYYFCGDTIYFNPSFNSMEYYKISRDDFLAGNMEKLEEAYNIDLLPYRPQK